MPGRFFLTRPISEIAELLGVSVDVPDQPLRRNIQPGQEMVVLTPKGMVSMR